jgi:hypothetical protein
VGTILERTALNKLKISSIIIIMAYINRLSDINNKLDKLNENQQTLNNISSNTDINIEEIKTNSTNANIKLDTLHTDLNTTLHGDLTTTNTKLDTLHTDLDNLTFDSSNNLNVNINKQTNYTQGSYNNMLNGTFNTNSYSTSLNINGYSSNSIISYSDTQNLTDTIIIFGSIDNSNFFHIGTLLPIYNSTLGRRYASTKINLAPIKYIKIYNTSTTNITSASCTVVSG